MKDQRRGGFLIGQIHRFGGRILSKKLQARGIEINPAQGRIMFVLWQDDGIPITELAKQTSLGKSTLTSMLDRLEQAGYLRRVPSPHDRRGEAKSAFRRAGAEPRPSEQQCDDGRAANRVGDCLRGHRVPGDHALELFGPGKDGRRDGSRHHGGTGATLPRSLGRSLGCGSLPPHLIDKPDKAVRLFIPRGLSANGEGKPGSPHRPHKLWNVKPAALRREIQTLDLVVDGFGRSDQSLPLFRREHALVDKVRHLVDKGVQIVERCVGFAFVQVLERAL